MLCFAWKEKEKILGYIHTESPLDTAHRWWTEIRERSIYQHTQSSISRTTVFSPVNRDISLYNNNTTRWKKRKQTPRLTRTFSLHADQISQRTFRALRCPFARTKGFVSSIIKTLRFSPPQRSASGLFRQWRIVQSSLETSSLGSMRANTHTRKRECVLYAYCYQTRWLSWLAEPNPPQPSRLTFSGDGVGFGHGSMERGGWIGRRKWNRKWNGSVDKQEYPPPPPSVSLLIHRRENSSLSFWNLNEFSTPENLFSSRMLLRKNSLLYLERFMKSTISLKICRQEIST